MAPVKKEKRKDQELIVELSRVILNSQLTSGTTHLGGHHTSGHLIFPKEDRTKKKQLMDILKN